VLVAGGRVVADGPTDEIRRQSSARTVRARIAAERLAPTSALLDARPDVQRVARSTAEGGSSSRPADSDAVARLLLGELGGWDLEIEPASLEHAFVRLTSNLGSAS
jgi:ABC-2 type transport system ATP-binding protein